MDLVELRRIAEAATKGNWKWEDWDRNDSEPENPDNRRWLVNDIPKYPGDGYYGDLTTVVLTVDDIVEREEDQLFIETFDPKTVLALIDMVEDWMGIV